MRLALLRPDVGELGAYLAQPGGDRLPSDPLADQGGELLVEPEQLQVFDRGVRPFTARQRGTDGATKRRLEGFRADLGRAGDLGGLDVPARLADADVAGATLHDMVHGILLVTVRTWTPALKQRDCRHFSTPIGWLCNWFYSLFSHFCQWSDENDY